MPTFEVECRSCHMLKWPTMPERPKTYQCQLCQSGAGQKRKAAGKAGVRKKGARVRPQTAA